MYNMSGFFVIFGQPRRSVAQQSEIYPDFYDRFVAVFGVFMGCVGCNGNMKESSIKTVS